MLGLQSGEVWPRLAARGKWMIEKGKARIGKVLAFGGSLWFALAFVWLSPLMILIGLLEPIWRAPYDTYRLIGRVEFPIAAATAATGALQWLQARRKLSTKDYLIVLASACVLVLAVYRFNGWLRL
jgi:hypothetical protein